MQELCFGRVSRGGTFCEHNVFIFVTEKEQNFQKNETIALRHLKSKAKKTKFIWTHTGILWSIFSIVEIPLIKNQMLCAKLTVVSFAAVVWSRHTTLSIPRWRESALRDVTK